MQRLQVHFSKGPFRNYVEKILIIFDHLPTYLPERGQKEAFFDHLPTSSCPRGFWSTPTEKTVLLVSLYLKNMPKNTLAVLNYFFDKLSQ